MFSWLFFFYGARFAVNAPRTSSIEVHRLQGQFIAQHVHYREVDEALGELATVWGLLRVSSSFCLLVLEVDPRWDGHAPSQP